MKRACGVVTLLVGAVGVILAAAAIAQTWRMAEQMRQAAPEALGHLEAITRSVNQQGEATVALLATTRTRVNEIRSPIAELSSRTQQVTTDSILEIVDEGIIQRLENAEEFARSMQTSMRGMSSALALLESLPFFPTRSASGVRGESQWKAVADSLAEAADLLERISQMIARLRSGRTMSPEQLTQLRETLDGVDRELGEVQTEIHRFLKSVSATGAQVAALRRNVPAWINNTAVAVTVFFVCFGFSQLSLLVQGWRLARDAVSPERASSKS